jgi:Predicted nucleotide-binding protein containing TIR-like domain
MTVEPIDVTVFYSWQSDLPNATNRQAIRLALRVASNKVEAEAPKFKLIPDEATRKVAGSPNIPATILDKIKLCDVFVCDITTINSATNSDARRTPNPNVLFELGYAVAHLGWNRIIMLFNDEFGTVSDVPFDIDRHRISRYKLAVDDAKDKSNNNQLAASLATGILSIVNENPVRPLGGVSLNPEQIKRQRDILNLKWLLAKVHIPTIDLMIFELPRILNSKALYFWEGFTAVVNNSLFHLYDQDVFIVIKSMHKAWNDCISNDEYYHSAPNPNLQIFSNPGDGALTKEQNRVWSKIDSARADLETSCAALIAIIREKYLEIDINEMNALAWQEYFKYQEKINFHEQSLITKN